MLISEISLSKLTRQQTTNLLFGNQHEQDNEFLTGDCILVFGGTYTERAEKAVQLFAAKRAPYILFTGGNKYGRRNQLEAILLRDRSIELGVPQESTWVETVSNNTLENIVCSLVVLERNLGLHNLRRLLLVSSPGHMRRCTLICRTFLPPWVELVWCPDNRQIGRRDNWWTDAEWEHRTAVEAYKVVNGVRERYFVDAAVSI